MNIAQRTLAIIGVSAACTAGAANYDATTGYVTLLKEGTGSVTAFNAADGNDFWSDRLAPHKGTNYYTGSVTFATPTSPGSALEWGGGRLVSEGRIWLVANKNITFGDLVMLPGSEFYLAGTPGATLGNVTICGTSKKPVQFLHKSSTRDSIMFGATVTGEAESVFKFVMQKSADSQVTVGGDFSGFLGTVILAGKGFTEGGTSAGYSIGTSIGGALKVESATRVTVVADATVGSLTLADGSEFRNDDGKSLTVKGDFVLGETARIVILNMPDFVYDDGSSVPPVIPVLSVCGSENAASVDRDKLLAALVRGGVSFGKTLASGVPRLRLLESERQDGGVDFKITHDPIVKQLKSNSLSYGPYGQGMYEDYLSDGQPISPDKDYTTAGYAAYPKPSVYEFPGRSWTISGCLGFYENLDLTVADLRVLTGAFLRYMGGSSLTLTLSGMVTLYGDLECRTRDNANWFFDSALSGNGNLLVTLDVEKANVSPFHGCVGLRGDNSAFRGKYCVGCGKKPTAKIGLTNLTLRVASGLNLGGDLDSFVFDGVRVADTCTLSVTNTATFEAKNRGWLLMDGATIDVAEGKTVTMKERVTFGARVAKVGVGTIMLGGPSMSYDAAQDVPQDSPSAVFDVNAGGLGVVAVSAFQGLSELAFASGSKFVVDTSASDGALIATGADLSAMSLTVPAGGVPVVFENVMKEMCLAVATFASAADAEKFVFKKPRGYLARRSIEQVGGKFILKATLEKSGIVLIVR